MKLLFYSALTGISLPYSTFSAINDETRNFDESNGGGPFNNDRENDGEGREMEISANRLYTAPVTTLLLRDVF